MICFRTVLLAVLMYLSAGCSWQSWQGPSPRCMPLLVPTDGFVGFDADVYEDQTWQGWRLYCEVQLRQGEYNYLRYESLTDPKRESVRGDGRALNLAMARLARRAVLGRLPTVTGDRLRRIQFNMYDASLGITIDSLLFYDRVSALPAPLRPYARQIPTPGRLIDSKLDNSGGFVYLRIEQVDRRSGRICSLLDTSWDQTADAPAEVDVCRPMFKSIVSASQQQRNRLVAELLYRVAEVRLSDLDAVADGDVWVSIGLSRDYYDTMVCFRSGNAGVLARGLESMLRK